MYQAKQIYDKLAVGRRIRGRRKRTGYLQAGAGFSDRKTEKSNADIERGYCGMSLDTMIDIAGCLGITLDYLVFGRNDREELTEDSSSILFYLGNCGEKKRKKAIELLRIYLSE